MSDYEVESIDTFYNPEVEHQREEDERAAHEKAERSRRQKLGKLKAAYRRVFPADNGDAMKVLDDLAGKSFLFESSYVPGCDPNETVNVEGRRWLMLHILSMRSEK